jgi:hypothetical protein
MASEEVGLPDGRLPAISSLCYEQPDEQRTDAQRSFSNSR